MSLSNKLTLDKVEVKGKRVVMRYCRVSPPSQLIGCEIICRLLSNWDVIPRICAAWFQKPFCPVMQARRRQTHSRRCVNRPWPSTRLQEVNLSRFHPCCGPVGRCCVDATDGCDLDFLTHPQVYPPLCSIHPTVLPLVQSIPHQAWRDMSLGRMFCCIL